jgi:hypothetical protein
MSGRTEVHRIPKPFELPQLRWRDTLQRLSLRSDFVLIVSLW